MLRRMRLEYRFYVTYIVCTIVYQSWGYITSIEYAIWSGCFEEANSYIEISSVHVQADDIAWYDCFE